MSRDFPTALVEHRARLLLEAEAPHVAWDDQSDVFKATWLRLARVTMLAGLRDPIPTWIAEEVEGVEFQSQPGTCGAVSPEGYRCNFEPHAEGLLLNHEHSFFDVKRGTLVAVWPSKATPSVEPQIKEKAA